MSKQILPSEIKVGDKLRVEQQFADGSHVLVIGVVRHSWDEFVSFAHDPRLAYNLHASVRMPNVMIHRLDS